jgi:hypothetical protein
MSFELVGRVGRKPVLRGQRRSGRLSGIEDSGARKTHKDTNNS